MALACSFGEIDNPSTEITPAQDVDPSPVVASNDKPVSGPATNNPTSGPSTSNTTDDEEDVYDPENDPFTSVLGKEVKQILEQNCGRCHEGTKSGDMDYILNLRELVKNNKVKPGVKEDSQLYVRMQQQSMPPAYERVQRPTFGQIDQVGQFIDELPPTLFGADDTCETLPFITQDEQIALMAQDISRLDAREQPFTRYLTITYSSNSGGCEGERKELERQRFALFKGINSVSTDPVVARPEAIDSGKTIYRIDIRVGRHLPAGPMPVPPTEGVLHVHPQDRHQRPDSRRPCDGHRLGLGPDRRPDPADGSDGRRDRFAHQRADACRPERDPAGRQQPAAAAAG
jgi:hypothetical protein